MKPARWLLTLVLAACSAQGPQGLVASAAPGTLAVVVRGGGTCTQYSTAPLCQPQPLTGAVVEVAKAGAVVARLVTDNRGAATTVLPPGTYAVTALPVEGWPMTPASEQVTITSAARQEVVLVHNTGFQ